MGIRLVKISSIYFAVGVLLGYYMSSTETFALAPVHVHINLLGWTSLTLAGILYHLFPDLAASKLGKWHFWLHNIGLPIMMISLAIVLAAEKASFLTGVAAGATITCIGVLLFVVNVLKNLKAQN